MRNRKAYQASTATKAPEPKASDTADVVKELRAMQSDLVNAVAKTTAVEAAHVKKAVAAVEKAVVAVEKAAARPKQIAIEVVRDDAGNIKGMIAHTDQKAINRIRKGSDEDGIEEWVKQSLN